MKAIILVAVLLSSLALGCATTRQCRTQDELRCTDGEVVCVWDTNLNCEVCTCEQSLDKSSDPNPRDPSHGPAPPPN